MDIWSIIQTLEGQTLYTLDTTRSSPFTIESVTHQTVTLRNSQGTSVNISWNKILECWNMLVEQHEIDLNIDMHVHLRLGGNASCVAAILACIPNVIVHTNPIMLEYHETSWTLTLTSPRGVEFPFPSPLHSAGED